MKCRKRLEILLIFCSGSLFFTVVNVFQTTELHETETDDGGKLYFAPDTFQPGTDEIDDMVKNQVKRSSQNTLHKKSPTTRPWKLARDDVQSDKFETTSRKKLHVSIEKSNTNSYSNKAARSTVALKYKKLTFEEKVRAVEFNVEVKANSYVASYSSGMTEQFSNDCIAKSLEPVSTYIHGKSRTIPFWQRKLKNCGNLTHQSEKGEWGYFMAELLQVRIYEGDLAKWSIKELLQWIHFMFLAGVDHIFLCDHYKDETERLDIPLKRYIDLNLITYFNWSHIKTAIDAQVKCYEHIVSKFGHRTMWTIAVDMDEYPVSFLDTKEGFLARYVVNTSLELDPRLSEISMSNFLMLGEGDSNRDIVSSRINRMTLKEYGQYVKPIFRPKRVYVGVHVNDIIFGHRTTADTRELRMLHYWGRRLQGWGSDTPEILNMTEQTSFMLQNWDDKIRDSLLVFGESDALG